MLKGSIKTDVLAALVCSVLGATGAQAADELVIASWGGVYKTATKTNFADPFSKASGIGNSFIDVGGGWAAKIEAQQAAGKVQWDVIDSIDAGSAEYLYAHGLLETVPDDLAKRMQDVSLPGAVKPYGIQEGNTGVVIVCRKDIAKCPSTAAEFFDPTAFPGPRAIVNEPNQVLPFAALAATGNPKTLFPVDLDKAFAMLNKVKSAVTVWPTSGDQQQQVLRSGEVDMAIMWNGRAYDLGQKGTPITIQWNGALNDPGYIVVLKGAPHKDAGLKFMEFYATHPELQAAWVKTLPYGMASKDLPKYLNPALADALPSSHQVVDIDPSWFAQNEKDVSKRWQEFLAGAH